MQVSGGQAALVEFSYASNAVQGLPASVYVRLARQAWSYNVRNGLTGTLRFDGSRFEQVLEGPSNTLLALAARVLSDPRHEAIRICGFRSIAARRFESWTMSGFEAAPTAGHLAGDAANLLRLPVAAASAPEPRIVALGAALVTS